MIEEQASRAGLSTSNYMRTVALGYPVPSREDAMARRELLKVNADQAKLGNLLKMAISSHNTPEINKLIKELTESQALLKSTVLEIRKLQ